MFFVALCAGMLAVFIILVFVIHGILDQIKSCLEGDFDGQSKRMKSRKGK